MTGWDNSCQKGGVQTLQSALCNTAMCGNVGEGKAMIHPDRLRLQKISFGKSGAKAIELLVIKNGS